MAASSGTSAASLPVEPGAVVANKYRVERLLGVGGMGVVVAATHLELGEQRALKFMRPEVSGDAANVTRFFREARAAARLKSEHVAHIFDLGRLDDGTPFLVLEYLDGEDLAVTLEEGGALSVDQAIDYTMQTLAALAEAHAVGIVHRDLKPANVFVTCGTDGLPLVKIVDFGLSKLMESGQVGVAAVTQAGAVIGSPHYMSPEQLASARLVDARTDLWSVGVMLYEMLTGARPFEGDSLTAVTIEVALAVPEKPSALRAGLAEGLDGAVLKCLSKKPEDRFRDAVELAVALAPFGDARTRALAAHVGQVHRAALGADGAGRSAAETPTSSGADRTTDSAPAVEPTSSGADRTTDSAPAVEPTAAAVRTNGARAGAREPLVSRFGPSHKAALALLGALAALAVAVALLRSPAVASAPGLGESDAGGNEPGAGANEPGVGAAFAAPPASSGTGGGASGVGSADAGVPNPDAGALRGVDGGASVDGGRPARRIGRGHLPDIYDDSYAPKR